MAAIDAALEANDASTMLITTESDTPADGTYLTENASAYDDNQYGNLAWVLDPPFIPAMDPSSQDNAQAQYLPRRSVSEPPGGGYQLDNHSAMHAQPAQRQPIFQRELRGQGRAKKTRLQPYTTKTAKPLRLRSRDYLTELQTVPIGMPAPADRSQITSQPSAPYSYNPILPSAPRPWSDLGHDNVGTTQQSHALLYMHRDELRSIIVETVRQTLKEITKSGTAQDF